MISRRVLLVIGSLEVGGAETHVVRVARELKSRGWDTEVFALLPAGPLAVELASAGVSIHGVSSTWCRQGRLLRLLVWLPATMLHLVVTMVKRQPAVCHFFLPAAYLLGGIAALISRRRNRIMSRRSLRDYQEDHPLLAIIEHRLIRHMDLVCGNSHAVTRQLAEEGVPLERLRLIYNGISALPSRAGLRDATRRALDIGEDIFVIVVIANLIPYKGHADLLDALSLIRSDLPQRWLLLVAGRDDGIGVSLERHARDSGIADNVMWLGLRPDVPELLAAADLSVLPSHQEGFSNAIIEAMAAGLPMVVTDVGGNSEAVVDGQTGYVVPARDPRALAEAILRMARDPQRAEFGKRGRQRVAQHFSLNACIDAYEALYLEVGAVE